MIMVNGNWEYVEDMEDACRIIKEQFNEELADTMLEFYHSLRSALADAEQEVSDLEFENDTLECDNDNLTDEINNLRDTISELEDSMS